MEGMAMQEAPRTSMNILSGFPNMEAGGRMLLQYTCKDVEPPHAAWTESSDPGWKKEAMV